MVIIIVCIFKHISEWSLGIVIECILKHITEWTQINIIMCTLNHNHFSEWTVVNIIWVYLITHLIELQLVMRILKHNYYYYNWKNSCYCYSVYFEANYWLNFSFSWYGLCLKAEYWINNSGFYCSTSMDGGNPLIIATMSSIAQFHRVA